MEKTAASSDALRLLLEDLKKQNDRALAAQLLQVKFSREIAGEDDDKREKQLAELIESSLKIEKALLGMNRGLGKLTDKLQKLPEFSKIQVPEDEMTLKEGLSELVGGIKGMFGGLGDKAKSVFETLKSPEKTLQAAKSGLTGAGEYISDIASAEAGFTTESDRFATERIKQENESRRKSGQAELTKDEQDTLRKESRQKFRDVVSKEKELKDVSAKIDESKKYGFTPTEEDIVSKKRLTEEISIKRKEAGVATFAPVDRKPEEKQLVEKQLVERKPEEKEQGPNPGVTGVNPEADNIQSAQEIIADSSKQDVELTKEIKKIQEEQLAELKQIRQALAPKTPAEAPETTQRTSPGSSQAREEEPSGGIGLGDALGGLGTLGKKAGGVLKSAGKGALSLGAKALKFAGSKGGMIAGSALAIGAGAYSAYKGYTGAEEEKQAGLQAIEAKVQSGEITPEEAEIQKKQLGEATVEKKGGAIGEGTGMAAGAVGGMKAGALLGATLGSAVPVVGTAIGAGIGTIAGGALGAFTGSKLGKSVGEFGGRLWTGIKNAPESMRRYNEIFSETDKNKGLKPVERLEGTSAAENINAGVWDGYSPATVETKTTPEPGVVAKQAVTGTASTVKRGNANWNDKSTVQTITEADGTKRLMTTDEVIAAKKSLRDSTVMSAGQGSGEVYQDSTFKDSGPGSEKISGEETRPNLTPPKEKGFFSRLGEGISNLFGGKSTSKLEGTSAAEMTDSTSSIEFRAQGGPVTQDKPYIVGEKGPELFVPQTSGKIDPDIENSPSFGGLSKSVNRRTGEITDRYNAGPLYTSVTKNAQGKTLRSETDINLGVGGVNIKESEGVQTRVGRGGLANADIVKNTDVLARARQKIGLDVNQVSIENADLSRDANRPATATQPVISNNTNNTNTTSYVPIKSTPRPEYTGSALDRYQSRVAVY